MLPARDLPANDPAAETLRASLNSCLATGDDGKPRLTVTLPDTAALEAIVQALARLLPLPSSPAP